MTPFDPDALVAMLQAFYPVPSGAALAQARAERPAYFANGTLFGSKGDKLQLPDGRVFDCILASGGPVAGRRWQALPVTPGTGDDPFPLEIGPLTPVDETVNYFGFGTAPTMVSIVSDQLSALDGSEGQLDGVQLNVEQFDPAGAGAALDDGALEDATNAHEDASTIADGQSFADVTDATSGQRGGVNDTRTGYDDPPPPDADVPDPGDPPAKTGGGGDGGPPKV
jgi:hypothetical protein